MLPKASLTLLLCALTSFLTVLAAPQVTNLPAQGSSGAQSQTVPQSSVNPLATTQPATGVSTVAQATGTVPVTNPSAASPQSATTPQSSTTPQGSTSSGGTTSSGERMQVIQSLYGFGGFVYSIGGCPAAEKMLTDFSNMKSVGSRIVVTFDDCLDANFYDQVFIAAGQAGIYVIPLAWISFDPGSFASQAVPRMEAVTEAVIKNPSNVLAVAFGDEPLLDNVAGSANTLASYVSQMKSKFTSAGLDMPVSISEMAGGWRNADVGDISSMVSAVDFFMINDMPYFFPDATSGGSQTSWNDFMSDLQYIASIANGKHLMITQTGWPSTTEQWAPTSPSIDVSVSSEESFWKLLDSQCSSFFKPNNLAWMWRSWDNNIPGWGVLDANGTPKFTLQASSSC